MPNFKKKYGIIHPWILSLLNLHWLEKILEFCEWWERYQFLLHFFDSNNINVTNYWHLELQWTLINTPDCDILFKYLWIRPFYWSMEE